MAVPFHTDMIKSRRLGAHEPIQVSWLSGLKYGRGIRCKSMSLATNRLCIFQTSNPTWSRNIQNPSDAIYRDVRWMEINPVDDVGIVLPPHPLISELCPR